jgi:hypothetical protein
VLSLLAWFIRSYPILSTSHKHHKSIAVAVFIVMSLLLTLAMATIFASSMVELVSLNETPISDSTRGQIACSIDQSGSCTLCSNDSNHTTSTTPVPYEYQCPEWSRDDVTRILQTQGKAGATLAIICMLYAIGSFRYGITIRKHIFDYKIAYV